VTSANWVLTEEEGPRKTANMEVKLLSKPTNDVEVILSSSDSSEATLDKESLTFTPANWNRIQELTISGEDDSVADDDVRVRIIGYTQSTDPNYISEGENRAHAFKYTFTNINDDLQKGLSPIVQIGEDQKINEQTRVILDGSASYDPDPTGRIISYKWNYVGQRSDIKIERERESISYFSAPDISETEVLLFSLEVVDDDLIAAYGSTSVTVMPIVELTAVASVTGAITPKYPEGSTLENVTSTDP
jgi:REJ domain.